MEHVTVLQWLRKLNVIDIIECFLQTNLSLLLELMSELYVIDVIKCCCCL